MTNFIVKPVYADMISPISPYDPTIIEAQGDFYNVLMGVFVLTTIVVGFILLRKLKKR